MTDSETMRDSETRIQKLSQPILKLNLPIQETTPIQKLRFRNLTIYTDSETAIQKLLPPIQKLRFKNYFHGFRTYSP